MKTRNFMWNCVLLATSAVILSACDPEPPNLKGRYVGARVFVGQEPRQIIAEVPAIKKENDNYRFDFEIVETLATAKREPIAVRFNGDGKTVFLSAPILGSLLGAPGISLQVDKECASGSLDEKALQMCWANSRIDIELRSRSQVIAQIYLQKDDTLPAAPGTDEDHPYTIDELMGRAKFQSYSVNQEAERVFQAKDNVKVAVGNLLPHFNMRDLLSVVSGGGPLGLVETVGDLLPFLFPSNWYKWDEAKELYSAAKKSFASLRGNEMNYVENIFYVIHRDQTVFDYIKDHLARTQDLYEMIVKRERFGQMPQGSADRFLLSMVSIEQDVEQFSLLLNQELSALSHSVALPPASGVKKLAQIEIPDLTNAKPIDAKAIDPVAKAVSLELKTLDFLIAASKNARGEQAFGFLDPNSSSSIGFGYAATLRIGKSRTKEIEIKKTETISLIEKKVLDVVSEYNNTLSFYRLSERGYQTSLKRLDVLYQRLRLGDDSISEETFVQELVEASQYALKYSSTRASAIYAYLIAISKVNRLVLQGFYSDLELVIPSESSNQ